jgi:hypothetical protein
MTAICVKLRSDTLSLPIINFFLIGYQQRELIFTNRLLNSIERFYIRIQKTNNIIIMFV